MSRAAVQSTLARVSSQPAYALISQCNKNRDVANIWANLGILDIYADSRRHCIYFWVSIYLLNGNELPLRTYASSALTIDIVLLLKKKGSPASSDSADLTSLIRRKHDETCRISPGLTIVSTRSGPGPGIIPRTYLVAPTTTIGQD